MSETSCPAKKSWKLRCCKARKRVVADWIATAAVLRAQGRQSLARDVEDYVGAIPPGLTEKEVLAKGLLAQLAAQRVRDRAPNREYEDPVR